MADDPRPFSPGIAGVIGAETSIGFVDGANGRLLYRGVPIEAISTACRFVSENTPPGPSAGTNITGTEMSLYI